MSIQDDIRTRARELMESGEVATFIGWEAGRFANQTTPLICVAPEDTERLVFTEYCVNNLAKYAKEQKTRGKVGLVVRGCDARAINRLIQDKQLAREDVYLIGVGCPMMRDRAGEVLAKCQMCAHRNPVVSDEFLGEQVEETPPEDRYAQATVVEAMDQRERQAFFNNAWSKCLRCYACRNVCPCCTCRTCFVDRHDVGWLGKQGNLNENRFYSLIRAFHVADRCIECGECERACPMGLPIMALNKKLAKDTAALFGDYESGMDAENPDALRRYSLDDIEEFM